MNHTVIHYGHARRVPLALVRIGVARWPVCEGAALHHATAMRGALRCGSFTRPLRLWRGPGLTAAVRCASGGAGAGGDGADHYATLGVPPSAGPEEIKAAYKKLALQYHPDRNSEPGAEERFKSISAAYHVIGNKQRRQQYDLERQLFSFGGPQQQWHGGAGPGAGPAGGGRTTYTYQRMSKEEADRLFEEIFGALRVEDILRGMDARRTTGPSGRSPGPENLFGSWRLYTSGAGQRTTVFVENFGGVRTPGMGMEAGEGPPHMRFGSFRVPRPGPGRAESGGDGNAYGGGGDASSRLYEELPRAALPPPSLASVARLVAWMVLLTTFVWLVLSTLVAHPIVALAVLVLMMVGRRGM